MLMQRSVRGFGEDFGVGGHIGESAECLGQSLRGDTQVQDNSPVRDRYASGICQGPERNGAMSEITKAYVTQMTFAKAFYRRIDEHSEGNESMNDSNYGTSFSPSSTDILTSISTYELYRRPATTGSTCLLLNPTHSKPSFMTPGSTPY